MFPQYYDLKDENKLPISARFIDPYDDSVYTPLRGEKLPSFLTRIAAHRQEKDLPEFYPHELRTLVVMSLAETASKEDLKNLFTPKSSTPDFATVVNLAKTLVQQKYYFKTVGYNQRQERAAGCHGCKLHKKRATFSPTITNAIKKIAGLGELAQSDQEKALGMCGMCGCDLKAKVGFGLQGVVAALTPDEIRAILLLYGPKAFEVCWILREAINDPSLHKVIESKVRLSGERTKGALETYKTNNVRIAKQGKQND